MKLGSFTKTPDERKRYTIDYTDWLGTSETIISAVFAVTPSTGIVPLQVDAHSIDGTGMLLAFFVSFGDLGVVYTVDIETTTSGGQVKEDKILFTIRDV